MAHAIFDETQQSNGLARSYYDTTPLMFGSKAFLLKPECSSALTVNIEKLTTASARPSMYTPLRRRFCFLHTIIHTNKSSFVFDSLLLVEATL